MKKNKILMIMPYFGELPRWFDLYYHSCRRNDFIDFLFITDCKEIKATANIKVVMMSFSSYCEMVSHKLKIDFSPNSPYKICDLRPFFYDIHEEYLRDYTFWGYGDIDVVYGNLRILLSSSRLKRYDIISSHSDRLSGHFCVVKKDSNYTKIGYKIKEWKHYLEEDYVYGLDEHDFTSLVFPAQKYIWSLYRRIGKYLNIKYYKFFDAFNVFFNVVSRHYLKEYLTSLIPRDNEVWEYNVKEGRVFNPQKKELPYLHFLFFKRTKFYDAKNYWRDDFWKIQDKRIDEITSETICFTNRYVFEKN